MAYVHPQLDVCRDIVRDEDYSPAEREHCAAILRAAHEREVQEGMAVETPAPRGFVS